MLKARAFDAIVLAGDAALGRRVEVSAVSAAHAHFAPVQVQRHVEEGDGHVVAERLVRTREATSGTGAGEAGLWARVARGVLGFEEVGTGALHAAPFSIGFQIF